jgi:Concanavalin A-like lectin/glucanases superfamily
LPAVLGGRVAALSRGPKGQPLQGHLRGSGSAVGRSFSRRTAAALTASVLGLFSVLVATAAPASAAAGHVHATVRDGAKLPGLKAGRAQPQPARGPVDRRAPKVHIPAEIGKQPQQAAKAAAAQRAVLAASGTAVTQARRTGKPAQVTSLTTPTSEVLAQPDGKLELISNALPVRVRSHGSWVALSTSLRRQHDGSWTAPLTTDPVRISGGGSTPLETLTDAATGLSVSMYWPSRLPAPQVSGSVAIYRSVLPGVDLRLQVGPTGDQETLVIRSKAAATNPALRSLRYLLRGSRGVILRPGTEDSVQAVDRATGSVLFTLGQPVVWDSSKGPIPGTAPSATSAGGKIFTVPTGRAVAAGGSELTLTLSPPAAALTGRGLVYPLYEDPDISDGPGSSGNSGFYYSEVANFGGKWNTTTGSTSQGSGSSVLELGFCGYSSCVYDWDGTEYSTYIVRDYFEMNTAPLEELNSAYPTVYQADFDITQEGNSDGCTAQTTSLYSSTATSISNSTAYGGPQGSSIATKSSDDGGSSSCKPGTDDFSITSYVNGQATQSGGAPAHMVFELRAPSETNELQYKTFLTNPSLDVYFNFAPLTVASGTLGVTPLVACTSTNYTSSATPGLKATGIDGNPSSQLQPLDYSFQLETSAGAQVANSPFPDGGSSGLTSGKAVTYTEPTSLAAGSYKYDVQLTNLPSTADGVQHRTSAWSSFYSFTDLPTGPSAAPTVTSFDYPANQWGQPQSAPGNFTVGTAGASNIAGFAYSFDGGVSAIPVPTCSYLTDGGLGLAVSQSGSTLGNWLTDGDVALLNGDGTAQIQVPPGTALTPGQHTLYVRSFDDAFNFSANYAAYTFYVAPDYQSSQPFTKIAAAPLVSSATGTNASLLISQPGTCCSVTSWDDSDNHLLFNATAVGQTFTLPISVPSAGTWQLGAEVDTDKGYGEGEVYLDQSSTDIALGGTNASPFDGYTPSIGSQYLDLGTQTLTAGAHTLTFTVTGQDASASGFQIAIDYLTLSPTNRYEAQSLPYSAAGYTGTVGPQCFPDIYWSDSCQLMLSNTSQNASMTTSFTVPVESDYALGVNLTYADDYGEDEFELLNSSGQLITVLDNSSPSGTPVDAYNATVEAKYLFLGGVHLAAGTYELKTVVVGTDASSVGNRYNAGINYIEAAPVTGATDASFTAAMNNLGIVSDGGTATGYNFDLTPGASNLSYQSLNPTAGITPGSATAAGSTFSLNGATFTMPELRSSGSTVLDDNVVPDGQTIPLPAVNATGVALLVASTCYASPAAAATISYSGAQSSNAAIPSVPDWILGGANMSPVMLLSHHDTGSTADTTGMPHLYEIMLPANPAAPLSSITLPVMSATFLPGAGCTNMLHILAIGTRSAADGPALQTAWSGAFSAPMDATFPQNPAMTNTTLREMVPVSSDGSGTAPQLRIHLSNAHTSTPVTFTAATVGAEVAAGGPGTLAVPATVTFGSSNSTSVTLPAGADAWSNPIPVPSVSGGSGWMVVSLYVPSTEAVPAVSIHDSNNMTTWWATGNDTADQTGTDDFVNTNSGGGNYYLAGIDVSQSPFTDGTVAVFGDQTATSAPQWSYGNWTSDLPADLQSVSDPIPGSLADTSTDDNIPPDWWRMNGTGLDTSATAYDSGTNATNNLTLNGATWSATNPGTGVSAGSLSLNGTSGYAQSASPVITSSSSFAVSAWAYLTSVPSGNAAVVAEDGGTNSNFYLGDYGGKWSFYFAGSNSSNPTLKVVSGPAVATDTWVNLVGVFNAAEGQIQLWVNGSEAAESSYAPAWWGTGDLTVGRDLYNAAKDDFFPGLISDVRAYNNTTMWGQDVAEIANDTGLSSITTSNAPAVYDDDVAIEPNVKDVIVSLGANDVLEGQSATTIENNLQVLVSDIQGRIFAAGAGTSDYQSGSATPVQVYITTIVPLGLSSSDPREGVREAVNNWLSGGTTAQGSIDIASAVAESSSPNLIDPSYFTSGVLNASYYSAIAEAIANTVPPLSL